MQQQADGKRHEGMYRLPQRQEHEVSGLPLICTQKYSVTRYKVTRRLYNAPDATPQGDELFIPLADLPSTPMASPDRKLVNQLIK